MAKVIPTVYHATLTGAAADTTALVDGVKWDAGHTVGGLSNLDDTADADKPISTATQTALDAKISSSLLTTRGDIIYRNATVPARLAIGPANTILQSNGTDPAWVASTTLGAGVATFLATPTSANLLAAVTDATGSGALAFANTPSLTTVNLAGVTNLTGGRIKFPATQVPDSDVNTLDDYEEGTWTPTITFSTPGDVAVTYSLQAAYYTKIGRSVTIQFAAAASAFTHTTAAGGFLCTGAPFAPTTDASFRAYGTSAVQGYTKAAATYTVGIIIGNTAGSIAVAGGGSGVAIASFVVADVPSGGTPAIVGTISYIV